MKYFSAWLLAFCLMTLPAIAETTGSALPQSQGDRLKLMMLRLQLVTETYAVNQDHYPDTLAQLYQQARQKDFWVDRLRFKRNGVPESMAVDPVLYLDVPQASGQQTGITSLPGTLPLGIIYYRAEAGKQYCIFALDQQGGLLKNAAGQDFVLSSDDHSRLCRLP